MKIYIIYISAYITEYYVLIFYIFPLEKLTSTNTTYLCQLQSQGWALRTGS